MWYIYTHISKHPYVHREGMWVPGTHMVHILHADKHPYIPREWDVGVRHTCGAHTYTQEITHAHIEKELTGTTCSGAVASSTQTLDPHGAVEHIRSLFLSSAGHRPTLAK